jgi:hypothetical protein
LIGNTDQITYDIFPETINHFTHEFEMSLR